MLDHVIGDAVGRDEETPWESATPRADESTKDESRETASQATLDEPLTALQGDNQVDNYINERLSPVKKSESSPSNDEIVKDESFSHADPPAVGKNAKVNAENPTANHENGTKTLASTQTPITTNKPTMSPETPTDSDLIARATKLFRDDRLLEAARLLRKVKNQALLEERDRQLLKKAEKFETAVADLTSSPSEGWTKQSESHRHHDMIIYYKVDNAKRLTARIESPIEPSLLSPLISVFNESELYETWVPHFSYPKMGICKSVKLCQSGRANQIIAVTGYMPWPIADREVVLDATAIDDIDANGHIVVKMEARHEGEVDGLIPPPREGIVRVDFDGGILFHKCPEDHLALCRSSCVHPDHGGKLMLVTFTMFCDAHIRYAPQSIINFVTRTVIGRMWGMLLDVAEQIRDGKRPLHAEAIAAKREHLYDWVDERIAIMLDTIDEAKLAYP